MQNATVDLIIQIKNAYMASKDQTTIPHSRLKEEVTKKLAELGYIKTYKVSGEKFKKIDIELTYENSSPALTDVRIFSKPGRRYYVSYTKLKPVIGGLGVSILSTSKGIKTNKEARQEKIGGELLFSIW